MTTSELQGKVIAGLDPAPELVRDDTIAWRAFAKSEFLGYARFLGERACCVNVRDPEPISTVVDFLASITEKDLDAVTADAPLRFHEARPGTPRHFEIGVIVHPSVAKMAVSAKAVGFMMPTTYLVFPAFRCEVTDSDDVEDVKYRIRKAVSYSRWQREPAPVVAMRYKIGNAKSTGGKALMLWVPAQAESWLEELKTKAGFMELENFERNGTTVRQEGGIITVETSKGVVSVKPERIQSWFRTFLREGAAAAERELHVA